MEGKKNEIEDIVRIELVVPDTVHFSGGPFCSFVNILPISSDNTKNDTSVTVDFISINLYGVSIYDNKLVATPKFQNTLRFPFLQAERDELQPNQDLSLIFSSDPVVFCTFKEFSSNFEELSYRFTTLLPPFLPPSLAGRHVSYSYYVYISIQYRNSIKLKETNTLSKKLEFNLLGSIYQELPLIDVKYYPILPKKGGFELCNLYKLNEEECVKLIQQHINETETSDNVYFNFKSKVLEVSQDQPVSDDRSKFLFSRDLDIIWFLWDELYESGGVQVTPTQSIIESFNSIVNHYSNFNYDTDLHKIDKYKGWFGHLFPPELQFNDHNTENIDNLLNIFLKKLELRMCSYYKMNIEDIRELSSPLKPETRSKDEETISFTFDGNKLCTCTISGFKSIDDSEELEVTVGSWFSIHFDFSEANRHCLKVQTSLHRLENYANSAKVMLSSVIEESMISLGKLNGTISSYLSSILVPSFKNAALNLSYNLEIKFFCFEEPVDIFDQYSIKNGLNKLKMVQWTRPVKIMQNNELRLKLDEFSELDTREELKYSKTFSKNKLSSFMFTNKKLQLYKVMKI